MGASPLPDDRVAAIYAALATHKGNISAAARESGADRGTVAKYAWMARMAGSQAEEPAPEPAPEPPPAASPTAHAGIRRVAVPRRLGLVYDIHCPYHDPAALEAAYAVLAAFRPDEIVVGGDGLDCYQISDYSKDPDRELALQDEMDAARPIWHRLHDLAGGRVRYMEGNHEHRLTRLLNKNPGLARLRACHFPRAAELPASWNWHPSQTHLQYGSLLVLHGDLNGKRGSAANPAGWMLQQLQRSAVFGHVHRQSSHVRSDYDGVPRGCFSVGMLGDPRKAGEYATCHGWTQGLALVEFSADGSAWQVHQVVIHDGRAVWGGQPS